MSVPLETKAGEDYWLLDSVPWSPVEALLGPGQSSFPFNGPVTNTFPFDRYYQGSVNGDRRHHTAVRSPSLGVRLLFS